MSHYEYDNNLIWESVKEVILERKNIQYIIPKKNKKWLLYDFYMISYLNSIIDNKNSVGRTGRPFEKTARMGINDNIRYSFEDAKEKLIEYLKPHLLDAVFFALCAEIRHANQIGGRNVQDKLKHYDQKRLWGIYWEKYQNKIGTNSNSVKILPRNERDLRKREDTEEEEDRYEKQSRSEKYSQSYKSAKEAIKKTKSSRRDFVEMCLDIYNMGGWSSSYGGSAWANIANGWLKLYNAKTEEQNFVYIDHIYDLQHNTDTVFNKVNQYYDSSQGYRWIGEALDLKAEIHYPQEIIKKISPSMQRISRFILKADGFEALESLDLVKEFEDKVIEQYNNNGYGNAVDFIRKAYSYSRLKNLFDGVEGFNNNNIIRNGKNISLQSAHILVDYVLNKNGINIGIEDDDEKEHDEKEPDENYYINTPEIGTDVVNVENPTKFNNENLLIIDIPSAKEYNIVQYYFLSNGFEWLTTGKEMWNPINPQNMLSIHVQPSILKIAIGHSDYQSGIKIPYDEFYNTYIKNSSDQSEEPDQSESKYGVTRNYVIRDSKEDLINKILEFAKDKDPKNINNFQEFATNELIEKIYNHFYHRIPTGDIFTAFPVKYFLLSDGSEPRFEDYMKPIIRYVLFNKFVTSKFDLNISKKDITDKILQFKKENNKIEAIKYIRDKVPKSYIEKFFPKFEYVPYKGEKETAQDFLSPEFIGLKMGKDFVEWIWENELSVNRELKYPSKEIRRILNDIEVSETLYEIKKVDHFYRIIDQLYEKYKNDPSMDLNLAINAAIFIINGYVPYNLAKKIQQRLPDADRNGPSYYFWYNELKNMTIIPSIRNSHWISSQSASKFGTYFMKYYVKMKNSQDKDEFRQI